MNRLTIVSAEKFRSPSDCWQLGVALERCLLRCPPVRSMSFLTDVVPSPRALRHVFSSGRLLHVELDGAALAAMVWGDELQATQPWLGATTLKSLVLQTSTVDEPDWALAVLCIPFSYPTDHQLPDLAAKAIKATCVALPALTHLHLLEPHSNDALQTIAQHLGGRLTFLRLNMDVQPIAVQLVALQSLYLKLSSSEQRVLHLPGTGSTCCLS